MHDCMQGKTLPSVNHLCLCPRGAPIRPAGACWRYAGSWSSSSLRSRVRKSNRQERLGQRLKEGLGTCQKQWYATCATIRKACLVLFCSTQLGANLVVSPFRVRCRPSMTVALILAMAVLKSVLSKQLRLSRHSAFLDSDWSRAEEQVIVCRQLLC